MDNIKICTNHIPLGDNNVSFGDIIQKVASENGKVVKTAEADEAPSSGQPEAEAKLVNEPEKGDDTSGGGKANNEEAPSSGQPEAEAKLVNEPKVEAEGQEEVKTASEDEEEKAEEATEEKKDEEVKEASKEEDEKEEDGEKEETKEASAVGFVKLSKLNSETRSFLKDYYSQYYPADYVEALLKEN